jgi:hypothetical protein
VLGAGANLTNLNVRTRTFIAGLIAARRGLGPVLRAASPTGAWRPRAHSPRWHRRRRVDVSQVIAAIDWVVEHRHDRGLDIRVLNLSYGRTRRERGGRSSYAVEQA